MVKKDKFNPQIKKIKLNPEQAVLSCNCYDNGDTYILWFESTNFSVVPGLGPACLLGLKVRSLGLPGTGGFQLGIGNSSSS
ncbi:MAG: hypothetical protein P9L96_00455 [Candidatus Gygaella obscura]|nr:hypothetical protein [Candidatus Gygaella obscura]